VQSLLRLRREHPALGGGRLWDLISDESGLVFLRESEQDRVLVVFNNSSGAREFRVPTADAMAQGSPSVKVVLGGGSAEVGGNEIRVSAPAKSLSIFTLN
jgi:Domain of unknown function (DUF3459)